MLIPNRIVAALALALLTAPSAATLAAEPSAPVQSEKASGQPAEPGTAVSSTKDQSAAYQKREAQNQSLAEFQGGDGGLYIGGGAVLVALIVVLLLVR